MLRWGGYDDVPADWGRSVVTLGVFDGVHRGHQYTISHAVARSADLGARCVVVTFDPHPSEAIRPGSHPSVLTDIEAKAELIEGLGADALCVISFTPQFAAVSARAFVHNVLVQRLGVTLVVVGASFRFGRGAEGDAELLRRLGKDWGFEVEEAELLGDDTAVFSSTYIRACIAAGDVERASEALGRLHRVDGVVVRGDRRGRQLGFPTANLAVAERVAIPVDGVYAGWLVRAGKRLPAAVSVGSNPTFQGQDRRVEAHIVDFDDELYGERVSVEFVTRLRPMRSFANIHDLMEQIGQDVVRVRSILSL